MMPPTTMRSTPAPFRTIFGLAPRLRDHPLQGLELLQAMPTRPQRTGHVFAEGAVEHPVEEPARQAPVDLLPPHLGVIGVGLPRGLVPHESLLLHRLQEAQHGRVGQIPILRPQVRVHLPDRGLAARPEPLQRLELTPRRQTLRHRNPPPGSTDRLALSYWTTRRLQDKTRSRADRRNESGDRTPPLSRIRLGRHVSPMSVSGTMEKAPGRLDRDLIETSS